MSRRNNINDNEVVLWAILAQLLQDDDTWIFGIEQYFDFREEAGDDCGEVFWTIACTY